MSSPYEWSVHIKSDKHELSSAYLVLIFLGEVPEDPNEWEISLNLVGLHSAYVDGGRHKEHLTEASVTLNDALSKRRDLPSLKPEVVVPYLTKNLHWRVLKIADKSAATLKSLHVAVKATSPQHPESITYGGITHGRDERHS